MESPCAREAKGADDRRINTHLEKIPTARRNVNCELCAQIKPYNNSGGCVCVNTVRLVDDKKNWIFTASTEYKIQPHQSMNSIHSFLDWSSVYRSCDGSAKISINLTEEERAKKVPHSTLKSTDRENRKHNRFHRTIRSSNLHTSKYSHQFP